MSPWSICGFNSQLYMLGELPCSSACSDGLADNASRLASTPQHLQACLYTTAYKASQQTDFDCADKMFSIDCQQQLICPRAAPEN
jgi:hypothetical protein